MALVRFRPRFPSRIPLTGFYLVVAGVAGTGAGMAAVDWLRWWPPFAFGAVFAVELGGVVLSAHALDRMRLGERAFLARLLSAAVAAGAVSINWFGHREHLGQAAFFAGMSALGYAVWLLDSAARRRDQLRAAGALPPTAPVYGALQWLRHPWMTRRARRLALVDPTLGLYGSLAAAAEQVRTLRRRKGIASALHARIIASVTDPTLADIALATFDLDEVAERLRASADYDGLTALIAADLAPARVATVPLALPHAPTDVDQRNEIGTAEAPPEPAAGLGVDVASGARPRRLVVRHVGRGVRLVREHRRRSPNRPAAAAPPATPRRPAELTRRLAVALAAGDRALPRKDIADLLSITPRRLRDILATSTEAPNS